MLGAEKTQCYVGHLFQAPTACRSTEDCDRLCKTAVSQFTQPPGMCEGISLTRASPAEHVSTLLEFCPFGNVAYNPGLFSAFVPGFSGMEWRFLSCELLVRVPVLGASKWPAGREEKRPERPRSDNG